MGDFASPEDIKAALADQVHTQVLDVRSEEEIAESGKLDHPNWKTTRCTPVGCDALTANPAEFVPNKEDTIVIYCKSGRRASRARQILLSKGYTKVLNAGGYTDVVIFLKSEPLLRA